MPAPAGIMTTTTNSPQVTVIIPVRNGELYIADAIRSVLMQNVAGLQLLISDNGSTDGTAQIIAAHAGSPVVTAIRQTESLSMLEHFNKCLDRVHSEYYMLLCHDDFLLGENTLANALEIMEAHPDASAVYCDLEYVDGKGRKLGTREFGGPAIMNALELGRRSVVSMRNLFGIPLLIRRSALASHRYNLTLPYVADVELSLFLASKGATHRLQAPLIANRYHASNSTRGLHGESLLQMKKLAALYAIGLDASDRLLMSVNAKLMFVAKFAFFRYLGLRDRLLKG
jgi:glycosyltransferase involved in cell wall biosynthesis